jgi:hypothetical protein
MMELPKMDPKRIGPSSDRLNGLSTESTDDISDDERCDEINGPDNRVNRDLKRRVLVPLSLTIEVFRPLPIPELLPECRFRSFDAFPSDRRSPFSPKGSENRLGSTGR